MYTVSDTNLSSMGSCIYSQVCVRTCLHQPLLLLLQLEQA